MPLPTVHRGFKLAIGSGLLYAVAMRLILHMPFFGAGHPPRESSWYPNDLWVMSFGFLVLSPIVVGWLTVSLAPADGKFHFASWIFTPWIAILLSLAVFMIGLIEGTICILMAAPIALLCSSVGGVAAGLIGRHRFRHRRAATLCLAILPFLISGVEAQFDAPLSIRTVNSQILIHAPAPVVWQNVKTVPLIRPSELRPTWSHRIGFPLPLEATLDHEGIGGVRHASFQGGLLFVETIDDWQPDWRIGFTIAADTAHIPPTTLDEHVTIGGRFFDVLHGEYRLEALPSGDILLHLTSSQRLNTDFNPYAALWTDAVMRDLQQSILEVVKHRSEADSIQ